MTLLNSPLLHFSCCLKGTIFPHSLCFLSERQGHASKQSQHTFGDFSHHKNMCAHIYNCTWLMPWLKQINVTFMKNIFYISFLYTESWPLTLFICRNLLLNYIIVAAVMVVIIIIVMLLVVIEEEKEEESWIILLVHGHWTSCQSSVIISSLHKLLCGA